MKRFFLLLVIVFGIAWMIYSLLDRANKKEGSILFKIIEGTK